ncbi:MAG: hypothetical protein Q9162_002630 [Coniocarpon cinnabarinum]
MANLLAKLQDSRQPPEIPTYSASMSSAAWLLDRSKEDVRRMLDVIRASSGYFEFQTMETTRLDALRSVFQRGPNPWKAAMILEELGLPYETKVRGRDSMLSDLQ